MGDHNGPTKGVSPRGQGDGRKYLPHAISALAAIVLSLGLSHFASTGKAGPAGPAGKSASSISEGVCAYFGPDAHGVSRFQLTTPNTNGTCSVGHFVSVAG